jgi:hypothetical protein
MHSRFYFVVAFTRLRNKALGSNSPVKTEQAIDERLGRA